ncbi:carbohydrate binding domain-containing protein [Roseimicrobium sp. ORNL1]|uniref:carbohydrate binding domain-containing protein n=1 Tax=Roseimicrobium sp. ORNL1 TaxID=2711231 RepID=UPI0013E109A4|nr:carbohydrate binding domain-containing protein [Roseimicrobium sp. ORNL1]QIF04327.1 hypothetical protein G5S37_23315 [Roseimicrobium sp. ORNL1]
MRSAAPLLSSSFPLRLAALASCVFLPLASTPAQSQPVMEKPAAGEPGWFPFHISAFDDTPALLDLSFLNETPAGKHGFIQAKGETLVDDRGTPWRYFGTNLTAASCFPTDEEAVKLAGHFAKCGINLVRFHFMDANWSGTQLVRKDGKPGLNEEALARLDFFFAELKKRGIYANLNLHVGRKYDDQPAGAPDMSKGIDNIYPPYVEALKQYARDLLQHVNPHTGLAYRDDPAVAIVEVNNENTLLFNAWWPAKVKGAVHDSVLKQWNESLAKKHGDDDASLRAKWGTRMADDGPNIIGNPTFTENAKGWWLDNQGGAEAKLSPAPDGKGVRITATKAGPANWHTQLLWAGLQIESGKTYRFRFRARAEKPAKIYASAQQSVAPYGMSGLWTLIDVGPEWKDYLYIFTAKDAQPGKVNLAFGPNQNTGWFEFTDVKLDAYTDGFLPNEASLAKGNIPLPDENANKAVQREYFEFLADKELAYAKEMHRFLKEDLKVKCLVSHSHIFFGALLGVRREAIVSDVVNANAYWHHPSFPGGQWDPKNWEVNQEVLSQNPVGGVLSELAVQRPTGKPFALTEWDIPAPIDSLAEGLPLVAAVAAYQGWSGITLYTFAHGREDFTADHFHSYFNFQAHPAKRAGIPFAALLFRTGAVDAGKQRAILTLTAASLLDDIAEFKGGVWANWRRFYEKANNDGSLALKRQTAVRIVEEGSTAPELKNPVEKSAPAVSDNGEIRWGAADKIATVVSPHVIFTSGSLGAKTHNLGPCSVNVAPLSGDGFGVWGLIAMDGKPLEKSKKLLCMALRRAENEGMGWRADRKTVGDKWGKAPSLVLGFEGKVFLPGGEKTNWKVSALGPDGQPTKVVSTKSNEFPMSPESGTVWWVAERE